MNADSLHFTYNTGETGVRENPFEFTSPGETREY